MSLASEVSRIVSLVPSLREALALSCPEKLAAATTGAADDERVSTPGAYWIAVSIGTIICVRSGFSGDVMPLPSPDESGIFYRYTSLGDNRA